MKLKLPECSHLIVLIVFVTELLCKTSSLMKKKYLLVEGTHSTSESTSFCISASLAMRKSKIRRLPFETASSKTVLH